MRPRIIQGGTPPRGPEVHLTGEEDHVISLLAEAWSAYSNLPVQHPIDQQKFAFYIHGCQELVGLRVARAADPDVWSIEDSPG